MLDDGTGRRRREEVEWKKETEFYEESGHGRCRKVERRLKIRNALLDKQVQG